MFPTFWLVNVLGATAACHFSRSEGPKMPRACHVSNILTCKYRATAACNFSTAELQKVVRERCVLYILSLKCASRYSDVQLFHIPTSKSASKLLCFVRFELQMCFSLQRPAILSTSELPKVLRDRQFFDILTWKCASRNSMSRLNLFFRSRRFSELTFRPSRLTNRWENTAFRDFPNIWRVCIFFLLTLLVFSAFHLLTLLLCSAFQLSILSEV